MSNISASAYPEKFLNLLKKIDHCKGALPWPFTDNYAFESQDKNNSYEQEYNYTDYTEDLYDENNTDYNYDSLTICSVKKYIEDSPISKITTQGLMCLSALFEQRCEDMLNKTKSRFQENGTFCPGRFDGFMCWPHGRAHSLVEAPCPPGIPYGEDNLSGYQFCESNGEWYKKGDETWSYWEDCNLYTAESFVPISTIVGDQELGFQNVCSVLQNVGFTVSLVCLVIALYIFIFFKKLRCTRNYIHICLMLSFILRYVVNLVTRVKDVYDDYGNDNDKETFPENMKHLKENFDQYCDPSGNVLSRAATCSLPVNYITTMGILYYAMTTNYFWLLIEGVYLQSLLTLGNLTSKYFPAFVLFGWGGPILSVGLWLVLVIAVEDPCWTIYSQPEQFSLVVQVPIILSIMINFVLFINIMRIICLKLRAKTMQKKDKIVRLALSTLALVTLLGTQHTVFFFLSVTLASLDVDIEVVGSIELVCISIQGAFTAILYCFRNSEVQTEVKKLWTKKNIKFTAAAFKTSLSTQSPSSRMSASFTSESPPRTSLGKKSPKSDHCHNLAEGFIKQSNNESKGRNLNFSISTKPLL
ncbi:secretin receptor-like isoform X1 [Clavelina lepadiformis]|uniref:secretin receptor-like isoform X1 n=2 Tax=Clavelina lepadiformis TaxID=159417 RepID=UPI004042FB2E